MSPVTALSSCNKSSSGCGRRHQSIDVICANFLKVWKETSIYVTCNCLLIGKEGETQSINVTCSCLIRVRKEGETNQSMSPGASINQCHLWLPSLGYGGKRLSAWPPGILRGRVQCRQAGGWRGTQTCEQKDGQLCESCGYLISYNGPSSYGMQPFKLIFTNFAYFKRISRFFDRCLLPANFMFL